MEVLLTIFVLGLIMAFSFADYGKVIASRSLTESSDRLRSLILRASSEAMLNGVKFRITFTPISNDPAERLRQQAETQNVPTETVQPILQIQSDPLSNPDNFGDVNPDWKMEKILQPGTRCVAVIGGQPKFDIQSNSPIAGPQPTIGEETSFSPLTFNPDGTCDWVTFVLTDLPPLDELQEGHAARILNVIVDGRTGQVWIQRALTVREVEVMNKYGASPILHQDFIDPKEITEQNILKINVGPGGARGGGVGGG